MGIQFEVSTRRKVILFIINHGFKLSVVSYAIGLIWMLLLAHHEFNAKTYFSENQLLPGMVDTMFSEYSYSKRIYHSLERECKGNQMLFQEKLKKELEDLNLDVYMQSFYVNKVMLNGTNVYASYRAPRSSGVESIVVNVPIGNKCNSFGATSLVLGFAKYVDKFSYWAKDIIFVFSDHGLYGIEAWLTSYFQEATSEIIKEELYGHGGSIQAAIVFDFDHEYVTYFDLLIDGVNGHQPNLDLVNLVFRIGKFENIPIKFKNQNLFHQPKNDYLSNLQTLLRMMVVQASSNPSGNHGLFYKYRIEAVTLKGKNDIVNMDRIYFEQQGRFLEGILRSLNNMLEHFHQSFFMYVLPNKSSYISIGMYMPPLAFLFLPLVIKFLMIWINVFQLEKEILFDDENVPQNVFLPLLFQRGIAKVLIMVLVSNYIVCQLIFKRQVLFYGYNILSRQCLICLTAVVFLKFIIENDVTNSNVLQLYAVLFLALTIGVISIFNFPLSFFIAMIFIPMVWIKWKVNVNRNRFISILQTLVFLLFNPFVMTYFICTIYYVNFKSSDNNIDQLLQKSLKLYENAFGGSADMTLAPTNNILDIVSFNILPLWFFFNCL